MTCSHYPPSGIHSVKPSLRDEAVTTAPARILLIEDDHDLRALLAGILNRAGYEVTESPDGFHCLEFCMPRGTGGEGPFYDVVLCDIRMPGLSGFEILDSIQHAHHDAAVVLMTAFADESTHERAYRHGAAGMLEKPFTPQALRGEIARVIAMNQEERISTAACSRHQAQEYWSC